MLTQIQINVIKRWLENGYTAVKVAAIYKVPVEVIEEIEEQINETKES